MFKSQYAAAVSGILMLLFFGWGCTKIDSTKLGQGLIPTVDNIHTFDTSLNVIAKNFDNLTYQNFTFNPTIKFLNAIG